MKYIYLLKRVEHNQAKVILKQRLLDAEKVEKQLHQYFGKSRFEMSKRVPKGKWMQAHIKIGISQDVNQRLQSVNADIFKSGKTEWFALHVLELIMAHLLIFWYAYRWIVLAIVVLLIIYGRSSSMN